MVTSMAGRGVITVKMKNNLDVDVGVGVDVDKYDFLKFSGQCACYKYETHSQTG